jgi:hypothetical protein
VIAVWLAQVLMAWRGPPDQGDARMSQVCDTTMLRARRPPTPAAAAATPGHAVVCHAVVLSICAAALVGSFVLKPDEDGLSLFGYRWPLHCWLHETFGVKCALCGLSRSFCSLARGDVAAGLGFHRLGPAVFALFCLEVPYRIYAIAINPKPIGARLARFHVTLVLIVGAALFANWLLTLGELIA